MATFALHTHCWGEEAENCKSRLDEHARVVYGEIKKKTTVDNLKK
jgi:hypothetical protein